jgi:segregation and condensation protein B
MNELIRFARPVEAPFKVAPESEGTPAVTEAVRIAEAMVFAARAPIALAEIAAKLPSHVDPESVMDELRRLYLPRGVNLVRRAGGYAFRTATDLAYLLAKEDTAPRRLSRAGLETLAIVAYHQPVTRAEIEDIRGVAVAKGTLDALLEAGFVRMRGRRKTPGRPITYGTTPDFLDHFGLDRLSDLPGIDELKAAGLIEGRARKGFTIPTPRDDDALADDEDPLDGDVAVDEALPTQEASASIKAPAVDEAPANAARAADETPPTEE